MLSTVLAAVAGTIVLAACAPQPPPASDPAPTATTTTTTTTTTAPPRPTVYAAACSGTLVATTPGSVASGAVDELSGIAASRRNPGVWWVHNDSGNAAALYAIGDDGRDLGTFTLTGATNADWEDIAVGPGPTAGTHYVYVADIGSISQPFVSTRPSVDVYRVPEPAVSSSASSGAVSLGGAEKLTFTYPAGAKYDAEALMVDPSTGELYIVTKEVAGATVFKAPANLAAGSTTVLTQVATPSAGAVTAVDVTAAGDFVALRTYTSVILYPRPAGQPLATAFSQRPCNGATAVEAQGESIGFTPDGRGYVTASEGVNPPLHRFRAP